MIGEKEFLRYSRTSMDSIQSLHIPQLQFQETVKLPRRRFGFPYTQCRESQIIQLARWLPRKRKMVFGKGTWSKSSNNAGNFFKEVHLAIISYTNIKKLVALIKYYFNYSNFYLIFKNLKKMLKVRYICGVSMSIGQDKLFKQNLFWDIFLEREKWIYLE